MRGFQIWSQFNSIPITFDLSFGQKNSKLQNLIIRHFRPFFQNWRNRILGQISTIFFRQKRVKCYPIWVLRSDLESSHQGNLSDHKMKGDWKLYFLAPMEISKQVLMRTAWNRPVLEKRYHWTSNASENHISPDPVTLNKSWNLGHPNGEVFADR